jgi:pentatricopeptide repeat protein
LERAAAVAEALLPTADEATAENVELLLFSRANAASSDVSSSSSNWKRAVAGTAAAAVALQLNLARCCCLARSYEKAVALYQQLEQQGALGSSEPYSWLCYSFALLQKGDVEGCSRGLAVALQQVGWDATARLHVLAATLQVRGRGRSVALQGCKKRGGVGWVGYFP